MRKISTRISDHWLVLTHLRGRKWRLQVWGDTPLEGEVIAEDEAEAKECALNATIERLNIDPSDAATRRIPHWNAVVTSRWDSRV
jgi:hypothetical protein